MTAPAHEAEAEARAEAEESHAHTCVVSAPGKAFLLGEYAVLEGAPAVVAAVTCRARGRFVVGARPASRLIEEAARVVNDDSASAEPAQPGAVVVDTRAFTDAHGRKLGTGSSAAVAAVAVAVLRERARADRTRAAFNETERSALFRLADQAHRASQGGVGSGADVAAAVYGGLIRFSRETATAGVGVDVAAKAKSNISTGNGGASPSIRRVPWPVGLEALWFSAPVSASTPAFIAEVKAYAVRAPQRYRDHLRALREHAEAGAAAFEAQAVREVLAHLAAYGTTMAALGADAAVPLVIPAFADAAQLAGELGGAAKPSGAGGGDIGVALFADAASRQAFADRLPQMGLTPLALQLDLAGTAREAEASPESKNV